MQSQNRRIVEITRTQYKQHWIHVTSEDPEIEENICSRSSQTRKANRGTGKGNNNKKVRARVRAATFQN